MKNNSKNYRSHCPINFLLESLGDKWTLLVIRDLMFKGKRYFGELLASNEKISTNILAERLKRLELNNIVNKVVDPANGAKVIYSLTNKGKDLMPLMLEVIAWSSKHDEFTNTLTPFMQAFDHDKSGLLAKLQFDLDKSRQ